MHYIVNCLPFLFTLLARFQLWYFAHPSCRPAVPTPTKWTLATAAAKEISTDGTAVAVSSESGIWNQNLAWKAFPLLLALFLTEPCKSHFVTCTFRNPWGPASWMSHSWRSWSACKRRGDEKWSICEKAVINVQIISDVQLNFYIWSFRPISSSPGG